MAKELVLPSRIQRSRARGWRMPPSAIYVGRPARWSNSWIIGSNMYDPAVPGGWRKVETIEDAIAAFRRCVDWDPDGIWWDSTDDEGNRVTAWGGFGPIHRNRKTAKAELAGHDLACWCGLCDAHRALGKPLGVDCPDCKPCHADVLLALANA